MSFLQLLSVTLEEYPILENMAPFYWYEMSRICNFSLSSQGAYLLKNYKNYLADPTRKAFFVKIDKELAGFVLLNQFKVYPKTQWSMAEFFILSKFQNQGIGRQVAYLLSYRHVEELLDEREIFLDHATVNRWVIKFSLSLEGVFHH